MAMTKLAPPRREQRRTHLDASVVPVERALLNCAEGLQEVQEYGARHGVPEDSVEAMIRAAQIRQFRILAEELHWW